MPSALTWLDFSEHDRRRVLDLITALGDRDTRDELGFSTIRDAFADAFFPGTTTLMTRARYFLFVPWIYLNLEQRNVPSAEVGARVRRVELALIDPLVQSDPDGAIGKRAGRNLRRTPSDIYWQGLGAWGIRLFPGSREQYQRWLDTFYAQEGRALRNDDGEPIDGSAARNWHPGLPSSPADFPEQASFALAKREAEYLRERILARCSGTLLAFLVDRGRLVDSVPFPWEHPQFAEFPPKIRLQLDHARNFSEVMWGAALLYNLMLAEKLESDEGISLYRDDLQNWAATLMQRKVVLARWDREDFWDVLTTVGARVSSLTRLFVEGWVRIGLDGSAEGVASNSMARRLVHEREQTVKRNRARLDNRRYLELWGGAAGTAQLNYRWLVARRIVTDILQV